MAMPQTAGPAPGYATHPRHQVTVHPCAKRVRAIFDGETLVDTTRAVVVRETRHVAVYYFPRADVRMDLLKRTDASTHCPFKGDASYFSVVVGDRRAENAVWTYERPFDEAAELADMVAFHWDAMDHWYEEDEEVFVHARDPFVRVDILPSSRAVKVAAGGEVVADTKRARFLFETGLPTRYYIPPEDVRMDLLAPSPTRTACPYKGEAVYWSATIGGAQFTDIAWSYPEPLEESARIRGLICFYPDKVDAIEVAQR